MTIQDPTPILLFGIAALIIIVVVIVLRRRIKTGSFKYGKFAAEVETKATTTPGPKTLEIIDSKVRRLRFWGPSTSSTTIGGSTVKKTDINLNDPPGAPPSNPTPGS